MRVGGLLMVAGGLIACDGAVRSGDDTVVPYRQPVKVQIVDGLALPTLAFAPGADLGDAACFAATDLADGGALMLVAPDDTGRLELVRGAMRETVATSAAARRRVSACALSLDAKGSPEIVVAWTGPGLAPTGETMHFRRDAAGAWQRARVADFAASQIAFNAKSPRGSEVVIVDATSKALHGTLESGAWVAHALPAQSFRHGGEGRSIAVAVDAAGRSHFALGADYYGDRGGQYAFWPSDRADFAPSAVAIVLDPADPMALPQIVHAEREVVAGGFEVSATNLYRSVIGPDASRDERWATATAITGYQSHLAPLPGQLAARLDADGWLHTAFAVRHDRSNGVSWTATYQHERGGEATSAELALRPTGGILLSGERTVIASDHGRLVSAERTHELPAVEPAPVLAPPSVGSVERCEALAADGATTVLRSVRGLSAVVLDDAGTGISAVEWSFERAAVRYTVGDPVGWDTRDITPWTLPTMGAGRSKMAREDGATHVVWPEAGRLAYWTDAYGGFTASTPRIDGVVGTPDLATVASTPWVASLVAGGTLVAVALPDGAPETIGTAEAFAFVKDAERASLVLARRDGASVHVVLAERGDDGAWRERDLGLEARGVLALDATLTRDGLRVIASVEGGVGYDVIVFAPPADAAAAGGDPRADGPRAEILGRWPSDAAPGTKTLHAAASDDGAVFAWDAGRAIESARLAGATTVRDTLTAAPDNALIGGFVTRDGRTVTVEQTPSGVEMVGRACR